MSSNKPIRVAIVEDDAWVRENLAREIGDTPGFECGGSYATAEAALTAIPARPPEVVVLDINLPGIDGIEATRRIREILAGRRLPIIALTANASTQDRAACFSAGMDDFIAKPVRAEQLAAMFEKWLTPSPRRN
jgi:CheY-like chemotaxis protein